MHLDEFVYCNVKPITEWFKSQFSVRYTIPGMRDLLRRLGFVCKQTKKVPSQADEAAQLKFLEQTLPMLIEQVEQGKAELYFADTTHPTNNTKTSRGWIRKGKDFKITCNSRRKRVNINGAVRAAKPEHLAYDIADTINAQSTQRLCRKLLVKHPGKPFILCAITPVITITAT